MPLMPATSKPATPDQVAAAVAAVRAFWQTGRDSWETVSTASAPQPPVRKTRANGMNRQSHAEGYVHGHKLVLLHRAAADAGMNPDTLQKAWKAARLYSEAQIDALCARIEKHHARFGPTHLSRVMAVADARRRDALARRAIAGRWGVSRLERAVQAANGRREHVGKRPAVPTDPAELRHALAALCDKWERFSAAAEPALPADLRAVVRRARTAVQKVKTAAVGWTTVGATAGTGGL